MHWPWKEGFPLGLKLGHGPNPKKISPFWVLIRCNTAHRDIPFCSLHDTFKKNVRWARRFGLQVFKQVLATWTLSLMDTDYSHSSHENQEGMGGEEIQDNFNTKEWNLEGSCFLNRKSIFQSQSLVTVQEAVMRLYLSQLSRSCVERIRPEKL